MQAITYMKNQINNLPSTTELEPDIFINHIVKKFELPRESSIYLTILNNLLLPRNLVLKIQNIKFILDNDEMKKKIMSENNNIKKNQNNQNHSFSCSLDISTNSSIYSNIKTGSKVTLPSVKKKETKNLNNEDSFHKSIFPKDNSFNHNENKQKKKVKFIDKLYNVPFANITLIQSYKKFNSYNNYMNKFNNDNNVCITKHSCCIIC